MKLREKGLLIIAIPLVLVLIVDVCLLFLLNQVEQAYSKEQHSRTVIGGINDVMDASKKIAWDFMVFSMTRSRESLEIYETDAKKISRVLNALKMAVGDDPIQEKNYAEFSKVLGQSLELLAEMKTSLSTKGADNPLKMNYYRKEIRNNLSLLFEISHRMSQIENERAKIEPIAAAQARLLIRCVLIVGIVTSVAMFLALALYYSKDIVTRLTVLVDNSMRLAGGRELKPLIKGTDEIANLDRIFHDVAAALNEAQRKERAIIDNVQDVICSVDENYTFTAVSPAVLRVWGYEESELLGQRLRNILAPFCNEERTVGATWAEEAKPPEPFVDAESRSDAKDGEAGARARHGLAPAEYQDLRKSVPAQDDIEKMFEALRAAKSSSAVSSVDAKVKRKDGTIAWMLWSIYWAAGERSFFCVAHDINERKMLDQMKQDFVNMVSHDLRTPLTGMRAFLDTLTAGAYGSLSERGQKTASGIKSSLGRLVNLVNDLLDIEKMEAGMMQLHLAIVSPSLILKNAMDLVSGFAEQQKVLLELEDQIDSNVTVEADDDRLVQVVQNLLSNAVKFSPQGARVRVSVFRQDGFIEVRVKDQGGGIPEESRRAIFDRYRQLNGSKEAPIAGTGLGLAICKAIIEQHRGKIGVDSTMGDGSTFWFRIPQIQAG